MNAILTLKPVTDKKGNVWHAGNIIGLSATQSKTFIAAKNGLDMAGTNFATAPTPDNTAAPVAAPSSADFSLATVGVRKAAGVDGGFTAPTTYNITATVDAVDQMKYHFDASPTGKAGTYNFGDGKPTANAANGEMGHTYAAAGDYTVTFVPADGSKNATVAITVVAPAAVVEPTPEPTPVTPEVTPVEPAPVEPTPEEPAPTV